MQHTPADLPQMEGARDERARLGALASYAVLDTPPEPAFDAIVRAAALVADVPTALVGLIDADRQWYKAKVGVDGEAVQRTTAFCDHVVRGDAEVVVPDARLDARFAETPDVRDPAGVRCYAGFPLRVEGGHVLGTLCVAGPEPKVFRDDQLIVLRTLAAQVVAELELRRVLAGREAQEAFLLTLLETVDVGVLACDADGALTHVNRAAQAMHGTDVAPGLDPGHWADVCSLWDEEGAVPLRPDEEPLARVLARGDVRGSYLSIVRPGVARRIVRCDGRRLLGPDGALTGAVVAMADVTLQRTAARELQTLVATDPLTGALNRRGLAERAAPIIAAALADDRPLSVAVVDFDHFKAVNDERGHAGGDALLVRTVAAWQERLRRADLIARLGGEEFAVVLVDCTRASALQVVEHLRTSTPDDATASAGIAFLRPGDDLEQVLDRADRALYRAKREGRDRTVIADDPADHTLRRAPLPAAPPGTLVPHEPASWRRFRDRR